MESVLEPTARKRRTWLRWILLLGFPLVIVTSGVAWWLVQDRQPPLTAEEQPFVGYWEPSGATPSPSRPGNTVGYEFRADRKVMYHRRDPQTGNRYSEDMGVRWRAEDGKFFYSTRAKRLFGFVSEPVVLEMRATWDGPDRIHMALVHHGPGGQPTDDLTRRPLPGGP